jgi:hypothetical protein
MAARGRTTSKKQASGPRWLARGWSLTTCVGKSLRGDLGGWAVLALFAATLAIAAPSLRSSVEEAMAPPREIRFTNTPTWIGDSLINELGRVASLQIDGTRPDQGQLTAIHHALDRSRWFEVVRTVHRAADGDIEVDATFLRPVAVVVDDFGEVVIGQGGRPLPAGIHMESGRHIVRITSPTENRPTRAQRQWLGDDMAAAIELHALLQLQPWVEQVKAIDLANYDRTGRLVLISHRGKRIVWGSRPGQETGLEATAPNKIARLANHYHTHRTIDLGVVHELDLTMASHTVER